MLRAIPGGEPVPRRLLPGPPDSGASPRAMCFCPGCQAVADAIVAGRALESYLPAIAN